MTELKSQGVWDMAIVDRWYYEVPVIRTERLILRPLYKSDAEDLKEFFSDPRMYHFVGRRMSYVERNPIYLFNRRWYSPKRDRMLRWGICFKTDNVVIGEIMLYDIEDDIKCRMGCRVSRALWGSGIAKEATKALAEYLTSQSVFPIIQAEVMAGNKASFGALTYSGFIIVDYIPQGRFGNTVSDYYIFQYIRPKEPEGEDTVMADKAEGFTETEENE